MAIRHPRGLRTSDLTPSDLSAAAVSILESYDANENTGLAMVAEMGQQGIVEVKVGRIRSRVSNSDAVIVGRRHVYIDGLQYFLRPLKGAPQLDWERRFVPHEVSGRRVGFGNSLQDRLKHATYDLGQHLQSRGLFEENPVQV